MFAEELGWGTTLLIGVALGFGGFAILIPWIQFFWKDFDAESKLFWPLFYAHMIIWTVGLCIVPSHWLDGIEKPALTVGLIALAGMVFSRFKNMK